VAYILEPLDRLVADTARGIQGERYILSESNQLRILHEVLEENEKIKALMVREVFSFTKGKEIEIYIKNYQVALTHLLDLLYSHERQIKDPSEDINRFFQTFFKSILSLLSFIEERFSKYFDKGGKVPDVYLALIRHEFGLKMDSISKNFQTDTPDTLIAVQLMEKLRTFIIPQKANTITYHNIMFHKELVKELEDFSHWEKGKGIYSGLQQLLIYLNFNDKEFINEMVNRFVKELNGLDDINEKIDRLLVYSKEINQLQLKPDSELQARHPSVKNQLSCWFAEELAYLERKLSGLNISIMDGSTPKESKTKVLCHLSVDQLGIFFRAATDLKLLTSPSQKTLFEKIVPGIATPHRSVLSPESMRTKSYAPEKNDLEALKDILMKLFRQVNTY
jgi:hypothetical protein